MPHQRHRHVFAQLIKRANLWPVVGLVGARQIGKSTLLRDQIQNKLGAKYLLLDRKVLQVQAKKAPEYFIRSHSEDLKIPLILDEVQKVAELFDAVKAEVDEKRRPGRFLLSGSTEFSNRTGIRESLTGRIGVSHLYPFTVSEVKELSFSTPWLTMKAIPRCSPSDLERFFIRGGMPGACFLRNESERKQYYDSWIDTTCFRDLQQIKDSRLSGTLAQDILYAICKLESPTLANLKRLLRFDIRKISRHIEGLKALFVIQSLPPHAMGSGKERYYPFDCGLASHLGAPLEQCRIIWALNECLAQFEYGGHSKPKVVFYESARHSLVHFVIDDRKKERAVLLSDEESPSDYSLRALKAFRTKVPHAELYVLAPICEKMTNENGIAFLPWTGMV